MKIKEFIKKIEKENYWVDYSNTRDHVLIGNENQEIKKIGVCWVATNKVLQQAKQEKINFIISHENLFYIESTHMYQGYYEARKEKEKFCLENNITVYRLHDGWDRYPIYGVSDMFARSIGLPFNERKVEDYYSVCDINGKYTISQIAGKMAKAFKKYGCGHVEILGDKDKTVKRFVIGCGAISDLATMLSFDADCVALADDGNNNWVEQQYCLDNDIGVILIHHSINEMAGIDGLKEYLEKSYPEIEVIRLSEGYKYSVIMS